jgi:hypothetical protein
MQNSIPTTKTGSVAIETLFQGSKSEDRYPIFSTHDGEKFRIHIVGNELKDAALLSHLDGLMVQLIGYVDDIKGHSRFVIDSDLTKSIKVIDLNDMQANPVTLDKAEQAGEKNADNKENP